MPTEPSPADVKLMRRSVVSEAGIAAFLAAAVFVATFWLESRWDGQAAIRENVRFVRQSVMDEAPAGPSRASTFRALHLRDLTWRTSTRRFTSSGTRSSQAAPIYTQAT